MSEPKSNSFASLAGLKSRLLGNEQEQEERAKKKAQDKEKRARNLPFEQSLKGKFQDFPPAEYESKLEKVRSITVAQGGKDLGFLPVMVSYQKENGTAGRVSFQITKDGILSGDKIPKELAHLSKQNIIDEVARIAEAMGVGMWHKLDITILPDSDSRDDDMFRDEKVGETRPLDKSEKGKIDPERLRFLSDQPGFKFGVVSKDWGFTSKGYEVGVFSKCMVFENHEVGNAAFIVDLGEEIEINEEMTKRQFNGKIINKEDAQALANQYLKPVLSAATTRRKLVEVLGAVRVPHLGDVWQEKMQEIIQNIQSKGVPSN